MRTISNRECGSGSRNFGLELAEEKTRRILFGRFAGMTCLRHGLGRPETFEFLGFKHVCGVDRRGRFALIRIPSAKSCRKFLARTREWILHNRHWRRWEQQERLTKMLRGFYQYFGLHHCERKLSWVRQQVQRQWISALNRRGQRRRTNWTRLKDRSTVVQTAVCSEPTPDGLNDADFSKGHLGSPV